MPFITETLFITFYVPPFPCKCGSKVWSNTTQIRCGERLPMWRARTLCGNCNEVTEWVVNPDAPMEHQSARSRLNRDWNETIE